MNIPDGASELIWIVAGSYTALMLFLFAAFGREETSHSSAAPHISVIVCARNEENNIPALVESLMGQTYRHAEFILVNDRSTDRTRILLDAVTKQDSRFRVVEIREQTSSLPPKKRAITEGIRAATGEIICLTDADCLPPPGWIEHLVNKFTPEVGLVAGFSPYQFARMTEAHPGIRALVGFVRFEETLTSFLAASAAKAGFPWLCSGRNLAYRRVVFDEVEGFEANKHSVSGDDDLFLQSVRKRTAWRILYTTDSFTFVPTTPPLRWVDFFNQRLRHFSDGKFYLPSVQLFLFLYHTANLIILAYFVSALTGFVPLSVGIGSLGLKLFADAVVLYRASRTFNEPISLTAFIPNCLAYIFYNILIGPLGFVGKFTWKK